MEGIRTTSEPSMPRLGLWDATSIIVGIIIGVGIFVTPALIFQKVPNAWSGVLVWALGGMLALVGALCFAELAAAYPRSGGEYVYLSRAYGPLVGYSYAWAQLAVIRPSGIGALAFVFGHHASELFGLGTHEALASALAVVAVLSVINLVEVSLGAWTQNVLTVVKVLGLGAIVVAGFFWSNPSPTTASPGEGQQHWLASAMILVLWAYGGWHEAAYVATEVKDGRRNVPRALILGTVLVTVIYLVVPAAMLWGLGFAGAQSENAAADVLGLAWDQGRTVLNVLVMISSLGAINGMIFTTARIYSVFGEDHGLFRPLSHWSRRLRTPARALVVQGLVSLLLIVLVAIQPASWTAAADQSTSGPRPVLVPPAAKSLESLIEYSAAVFWFFFLLTGIALFRLRVKDADVPRPFLVPAYPWLPLVFCGLCGYMMVGALLFTGRDSLIGAAILAAGLPFYFIPRKLGRKRAPAEEGVLAGAGQGESSA